MPQDGKEFKEEEKLSHPLLWKQAHTDRLTNLPNRGYFLEQLGAILKQESLKLATIAIIFLDLDNFKEVNDTLGHDIGDYLLISVGKRIRKCLHKKDLLARLGGDEFAIMMKIKDKSQAEHMMSYILKQMQKPYLIGPHTLYISASIGITLFPLDGESSVSLLRNADQAMYSVKNNGKNKFNFFTPILQEQAIEKMKLRNELREALKLHQFEIYYQPIIDLLTGQIHQGEALLRWNHPSGQILCAEKFIKMLEITQWIVAVDEWMFKITSKSLKAWRELDPKFQLFVNTSPLQFQKEDHPFLENTTNVPVGMVIEITEGLLFDFHEDTLNKIFALQEKGIQIAIDDFGTGYSSYSYLKNLNINYLKINQAFIPSLQEHTKLYILCESIIDMAHRLNIKVIAEDIETQEQFDIIKKMHCDYGQGYFFSAAIPKKEFTRLLNKIR